ncbi:hypothetical protein [Sorangium sp. So ce693]|uniref:hypothetical protein n=1 Tax=Sorangium sp. So ce693 TaxID=3133318 RepID=UPI003F5DDF3B
MVHRSGHVEPWTSAVTCGAAGVDVDAGELGAAVVHLVELVHGASNEEELERELAAAPRSAAWGAGVEADAGELGAVAIHHRTGHVKPRTEAVASDFICMASDFKAPSGQTGR